MPNAATEPRGLVLDPEQLEAMRRHALTESPREACGLLLGAAEGEIWTLAEARPADNEADRDDRFVISPHEVLAAMRRARQIGAEVLGAYHSHPGGGTWPSATDAAEAWGGWLYVILGEVHFRDVAAWHWRGSAFERAELRVAGGQGEQLPGPMGCQAR